MSTRKTLEKKANSKGIVFALVSDGSTFEVWKLCENYNGKVKGGIAKQWRYVQKGMSEVDARNLFNKHTRQGTVDGCL